MIFDSLVGGEASSPATATPPVFTGIFQIPVVKSARKRFYLRKMGFFYEKIAPCATYTPPHTILQAGLYSFLETQKLPENDF